MATASLQGVAGVGARRKAFMLMQTGRLVSYAVAGIAVGLLGSAFYAMLNLAFLNEGLHWVTALGIAYTGLVLLDVTPALRLPGVFQRLLPPRERVRWWPLLTGLTWGAAPCAMVYNALLLAMLGGSAWYGALIMAAFWLGTLPALTLAVSSGIASLVALSHRAKRRTFGGMLLVLAFLSLSIEHRELAMLCA